MQQQRPDPAPRRRIRIGVVTGVIAASLLGAGVAAAQTPSASPNAGGSSGAQPGSPMGHQGYQMGGGRDQSGRQGMGGRGYGPMDQGGRQGMGGRGYGPMDQGGRQGMGGREGMGGRGYGPMDQGGRQMWHMDPSAVTVSAILAPVISLATDDGWTRDIDTTGVVISRGGQTITLADVSVGDNIQVAQTRNADGTWTVTGIEVQPAMVSGTVASVGTDSFTVTMPDGTVATVRVSDTTRWMARRGNSAGLSSLTVGAGVVAEGVRAADGSIDATAVGVGGMGQTMPMTPSASPSAGPNQG